MSWEIEFENLPVGYAHAVNEDEGTVQIKSIEFCSSEDGDHFIQRLEGFPSEVIKKLPNDEKIKESEVDHMLVIIQKDKSAIAYVNELSFIAQVETKKDKVNKGDLVYKDDIADIIDFVIQDVEIPNDCGVFFLFSVGWRKGLFFDYSPLLPDKDILRSFDLSKEFAALYTYLSYQNRFKITEATWNNLFKAGWFPFNALSEKSIDRLIKLAQHAEDPDKALEDIREDITFRLGGWLKKWGNADHIKPHIAFLETAVQRFKNQDYISAVSILFPRIEGILREHHFTINPNATTTKQDALASSAVQKIGTDENPKHLILPEKFRQYLAEVYFANFDPHAPEGTSRNTIGHGVANTEDFNEKNACLAFLIIEQLCMCMNNGNKS